MTLYDRMLGETTDRYGRHHWTWFENNGKSAEENYMIQKAEMRGWYEAVMAERRAKREKEGDLTNVVINIETKVR